MCVGVNNDVDPVANLHFTSLTGNTYSVLHGIASVKVNPYVWSLIILGV